MRDLRPKLRLETAEEIAASEQDLLAEFVLARASAGVLDDTIRGDVGPVTALREWFGRPLWEMDPQDLDRYFGRYRRDSAAGTKVRQAIAFSLFFEFLELRHKAAIQAATGFIVESPLDEVNRPRGGTSARLRIPPPEAEIAALLGGWRCDMEEARKYAPAANLEIFLSLFGTLKAERLIFSNPMRGIKGGRIPTAIPASLTTDEMEAVAQAALQDPALRVVVALSGVHALPALQIRTLLDQVDLAECRLDPESLNRPLDEYTAKAITDYLDYRRGRWPNSTNPHLLISRNTATTTTAVGTFWLDKLVKPLPVGLDRLRQDRILEEALASGADPLHLAHVFSLGAKTSLRYTTAVAPSAAEHDSRNC
ncbi:hypothetical protein [Streptomyces sp. NPDC001811]